MQRQTSIENLEPNSEERIEREVKDPPATPLYHLTDKQKKEDELLFQLMPELKKLLGEKWAATIKRPLNCDEVLDDLKELQKALIIYHNEVWEYSIKMGSCGGFGFLASLLLCCCAPPSTLPYVPALLVPSIGASCIGGVGSGNLPRAETYELISSTIMAVRNIKKHLSLSNGIDSQVSVTSRGLHPPASGNKSSGPGEESVPLLRHVQ